MPRSTATPYHWNNWSDKFVYRFPSQNRAFTCPGYMYSILESEEIRASQVEPVKPAKCSESSNPAHVSEIEFSCRLMAISWRRRRWCELVAAGTVCKDRKVCFKIDHNCQGSECMYDTTTSPCSRRLRLSKFSSSMGPPGVVRGQFRLIIKYVDCFCGSTWAHQISRIKYA